MSEDTRMRNEWAEQDGKRIEELELQLSAARVEVEKLMECQKASKEIGSELAKDLSLAEAERDRYKQAAQTAIEVAEDAVNQARYPDGSPSYFDTKWGWTEAIKRAKTLLESGGTKCQAEGKLDAS